MWGRGQRNKVMKCGAAPENLLSMGPERPRYATAHATAAHTYPESFRVGLSSPIPSGVTGGGRGAECPPETSDWEIFADV